MKDLKRKKVIAEINGEVKHYNSLREFSIENEISYMTCQNWILGRNKPSIDIKIRYE